MLKAHNGETLLQRYEAFWQRAEAEGVDVILYPCPRCQQPLKTGRPPMDDDPWDSQFRCPYCGELFTRVAYHNGQVKTLAPEINQHSHKGAA